MDAAKKASEPFNARLTEVVRDVRDATPFGRAAE
jgi:hypothetical protein